MTTQPTVFNPATKSQVAKLAAKKWPRAAIDEWKDAPTKAQREANSIRRREIDARVVEIDAEMKAIGPHTDRLMKMARFVVDVDGDKTAIEELRKALEPAERFQAIHAERRDLLEERRNISPCLRRWRVVRPLGSMGREIMCQADSLDELREEIERSDRR